MTLLGAVCAGSQHCRLYPRTRPDIGKLGEGVILEYTHCFQTPLDPAGMEEPASMLCLRTCYIKPCKPLGIAENPPELGQSPLSRSCSCSRRMVKQEWSNSVSKCALPVIPEYPGFQDVKVRMPKLSLQYYGDCYLFFCRMNNSLMFWKADV